MKAIFTSKFFWQIPPEPYAGYNVVLDLDGTIVNDSDETVSEAFQTAVFRWKTTCNVVLFSNSVLKERNQNIAKQLGLEFLQTPYTKPDKRLIAYLPKGKLLIIGDKMITDGLTAYRADCEYLQVSRLVSGNESLYVKFLYYVDNFFTKGFVIFSQIFGWAEVYLD